MIQSLVTSFRYNGRRRCDFSVSFDNSCSCCKETTPTQSVLLGARLRLDAAQATVTVTKWSSLIFIKFRLCRRPSVHTGNKVELNSLSRSTLSPKLNMFNSVDFVQSGRFLSPECRPNVKRSFDFIANVYWAKATTLSTFDTVDRVEFDFVASMYQA